jgi:hypothetical protein
MEKFTLLEQAREELRPLATESAFVSSAGPLTSQSSGLDCCCSAAYAGIAFLWFVRVGRIPGRCAAEGYDPPGAKRFLCS